MTHLHILLCVLFTPCIFAELFSFKNPFGTVAVATFEEQKIIENFDRETRDIKKQDQEQAVLGTPKIFTGTSEIKNIHQETANADKGKEAEHQKETLAQESLQENRTARDLKLRNKISEIMKLHQSNYTSAQSNYTSTNAPVPSELVYSTLSGGQKRELMKTAPSKVTAAHHDVSKLQDPNATQKSARNAFFEEYKRHLSDRFNLPVARAVGNNPSNIQYSLEQSCAKRSPESSNEKVVNTRELELVNVVVSDPSGSVSEEDFRFRPVPRLPIPVDDYAAVPPAAAPSIERENTERTEEPRTTGEPRIKRESQSSTTQKTTYEDDDDLLDEDDEGEVMKRENSKKPLKHWEHWGPWTSCSVSCGVGKVTRWRHCMGEGCAAGEKEAQIKTCTQPACL